MDLNKLNIFKCVADKGGISIASSELNMRQSSISTAISSLEAELGYKVLQRHYRGMRLTEKGERLYRYAKKALAEYNLFLDATDGCSGESKVQGVLTIATSFGISSSDWFVKKVIDIMNKFPELKLRVVNYAGDEININFADVVICPYINSRSDLVQNTIEEFNFRLFASREYIDNFGLPNKMSELGNHKLLSFSKVLKNPFDDADSLLHKEMGLNELREISLEINNSIGLIKIVKKGYGIASLPVEEGLEEGLIPLFSANDIVSKSTCFTYHKENKDSKNILAVQTIFLI